jgi:hypothetical protein
VGVYYKLGYKVNSSCMVSLVEWKRWRLLYRIGKVTAPRIDSGLFAYKAPADVRFIRGNSFLRYMVMEGEGRILPYSGQIKSLPADPFQFAGFWNDLLSMKQGDVISGVLDFSQNTVLLSWFKPTRILPYVQLENK